jgi:Leucine-rich repeat (LRR) protein
MSQIPTRPRSIRCYLRFSLRAFLIVAALLSTGLGWVAMRVGVVRRERAAVAAFDRCQVYYDYQRRSAYSAAELDFETLNQPDYFEWGYYDEDAIPPGPEWLRQWLGDDILASVTYIQIPGQYRPVPGTNVAKLQTADLTPLSQLSSLEHVVFTSDIAAADLNYLSGLKNLKVLVLQGISSDSAARPIRPTSPNGLERLAATGHDVTGEVFKYIGSIHSLKHLLLDHTETNDEDMACLRDLTALETLSLAGTWVGDEGVANCARMLRLQRLDLSETIVRGTCLDDLQQLRELKSLHLGKCQVDDFGLEFIGRSISLVELDLSGTKITNLGLAQLASLKNLRKLDLGANRISDAGLAVLSHLPELRQLKLDSTGVSDKTLALIAQLSRLEHLGLNGTQVTDAGLVHLRGLSRLATLELAGTDVSDAGLDDLRALPKLRQIDVNRTGVTFAALVAMKKANPGLEYSIGARRGTDAPPLPVVDWSQPDDEEDE